MKMKNLGQKAVLVTASLSMLAAAPKEEQMSFTDTEAYVLLDMMNNLTKRAPEICGTTGKELAQESDKSLAQMRRCLEALDIYFSKIYFSKTVLGEIINSVARKVNHCGVSPEKFDREVEYRVEKTVLERSRKEAVEQGDHENARAIGRELDQVNYRHTGDGPLYLGSIKQRFPDIPVVVPGSGQDDGLKFADEEELNRVKKEQQRRQSSGGEKVPVGQALSPEQKTCLDAIPNQLIEEVRIRVQKIDSDELTKVCNPRLVDRCL